MKNNLGSNDSMTTYTKTFIICPHCGIHTDSSIDHLKIDNTFGPWFCEKCGGGYTGSIGNNRVVTLKKYTKSRFNKTLDLLVLEPQDKPIYFVLTGRHYQTIPDDAYDGVQYFYEEHSCPTNWIGNTVMISVDGNTDPHGFLRYVRSMPSRLSGIPNARAEEIIKAFPEVVNT
jgi:ribosomal protein L37AE/L43A